MFYRRFKIVQHPFRFDCQEDMDFMMKAGIILHILILEALRDSYESRICDFTHLEEAQGFSMWVKC